MNTSTDNNFMPVSAYWDLFPISNQVDFKDLDITK